MPDFLGFFIESSRISHLSKTFSSSPGRLSDGQRQLGQLGSEAQQGFDLPWFRRSARCRGEWRGPKTLSAGEVAALLFFFVKKKKGELLGVLFWASTWGQMFFGMFECRKENTLQNVQNPGVQNCGMFCW